MTPARIVQEVEKFRTREQTAEFIASQWKEAKGPQPCITCECGRVIPIRFMYRCLYCGTWRCQSCAEAHFGKTREQYNAERELQT